MRCAVGPMHDDDENLSMLSAAAVVIVKKEKRAFYAANVYCSNGVLNLAQIWFLFLNVKSMLSVSFVLFICFDTVPSQFSAHINFKRHWCRFTSVFISIVCVCVCVLNAQAAGFHTIDEVNKCLLSFHRLRYVCRCVSSSSASHHTHTHSTQFSRCIGWSVRVQYHCWEPLDFKIFRH